MHQDKEPDNDDKSVRELLHHANLGAVVIGRNEASNLVRCIRSLRGCATIVYVNSCSTDGSASLAAQLGAQVIELTMELPFTAARARNAGFRKLYSSNHNLKYVQFVDGDCEITTEWITHAFEFLEANPNVAVVCGRRLERYPDASIYNAMCHREWDTPIGEADACGGDAMMRVSVFRAVGGFADAQVAHEEPEFCGRLRRAGWKIWRTDHLMTLHDAGLKRVTQFYKRSRRAGFGITQCLVRSGLDIDPGGRVIIQRAFLWSIILPSAILVLANFFGSFAALAFIIYPAQVARHAILDKHHIGGTFGRRLHVSVLSMLEKFAVTHGSFEFGLKHVLGLKKKAILYK